MNVYEVSIWCEGSASDNYATSKDKGYCQRFADEAEAWRVYNMLEMADSDYTPQERPYKEIVLLSLDESGEIEDWSPLATHYFVEMV